MRTVTLLLALLMLSAPLRAEEPFSLEKTPGKLPKDVLPRSYAIFITPDFDAKTFTGDVSIRVEATKPVRQFMLNSLGLTIRKATVTEPRAQFNPGAQPQPLTTQLDEKAQTLTLDLAAELPAGSYVLDLSFAGKLNEQPVGLFIAPYQVGDQKKFALTTQFEATDARRMFPCWDEPVFRAIFELTVAAPKKMEVISNMSVREKKDGDAGTHIVAFHMSPSMPTYLLHLTVGEMESIHDEIDGIPLGIYFTAGKREQARYAMEATKRVLPYFNDYFGTKYPLPKLDQIALPSTGASGMENWGAILYNDSALLFDPVKSAQSTKERVYEVIAHELAHQWFGNLVTMAWWDNLWLNEGFASWMGTKATDRFNPDWKMWLRAAADKEWAMALDARATTHPIQQPIADEAQASDAFDVITYQKGQSFLRMLESWLGEEQFREGIRAYMKRHAFSNTTTADLWTAFEESSGKQVREMARGWTEQPGFPVVNVTSSEDGEISLAQQRFTIHQENPAPLHWQIPVVIARGLTTTSTEVTLLGEAPARLSKGNSQPLRVNAGDVGYYRVAYDRQNFAELVQQIAIIPEADRLRMLNDTWALVQAQRTRAADFLELATKLAPTESYPILESLLAKFWAMDALQRGQPSRTAFHAWARALLQPQFARLGWEAKPGESPLAAQLRGNLIGTLGRFGDEQILAEARQRFAAFLEKPESLPGNLRRPVLLLVGREGDEAVWEKLHQLGKAENSFEMKRIFYVAMASARSPLLAAKTLQLALADELVAEEATRLVGRVADEGEQPQLAWEFAREHVDTLLGKLSALRANDYIPSLFRAFSDAARADELEAFAKQKLPAEAANAVARAADEVRFKAKFRAHFLPQLETWCREHATR